ncbi:thiol reductase thioredoxin [Kushneria pakistanensis]|uniref:Thiol reductase thioredoxin n=1 Tax=Kushneria pakistanensis TaxID=1508770 RepID=A0ABQ3FIF0_9GAMM|nr:thioredoxin family protein [Kushneria pakistanensis]GHC25797.1 thiol reductase thioredoxin [Kushneria pakistanensis]
MTIPDSVVPERSELDASQEPVVVEFGTPWCGYCKAAQPLIREVIDQADGVRHVRVEDGKGKRLGRSYQVKLWPTLIFLKDGQERARCVRPDTREALEAALASILE